jgi:hypothetical protein
MGERTAAARRLRREGLAKSAIADALGVSPRTVGNYLASRPCTECGTPVVKSSSGRCRKCAAAARPAAPWDRDSVLDALRRWTLETARQPTATDWGGRDERDTDERASEQASAGMAGWLTASNAPLLPAGGGAGSDHVRLC